MQGLNLRTTIFIKSYNPFSFQADFSHTATRVTVIIKVRIFQEMSTKQDKLCIISKLKFTYLLMTWFLTLPSSCKCFAGAGLGPGGSRLGDAWTWTGQFFSLWKPKIDLEEAVQNKQLCPCWISSYVPGFPSEGGNCFACRPGRSVAPESYVLLLHRSTTSFVTFHHILSLCPDMGRACELFLALRTLPLAAKHEGRFHFQCQKGSTKWQERSI